MDDFLYQFLESPNRDLWNRILGLSIEDFSADSLDKFCDSLVLRFAEDLLAGVQTLSSAGLEFFAKEPIKVRTAASAGDFPLSPPPLLAAWCRWIAEIDLTQKTEQMLDAESLFRGFGIFRTDLKWQAPSDFQDSDSSFYCREGVWYLNAFTMSGQMLILEPHTVDCMLVDGDDDMQSLYECMRRSAEYGGFSRVTAAAKSNARLAPRREALPATFPQLLSF